MKREENSALADLKELGARGRAGSRFSGSPQSRPGSAPPHPAPQGAAAPILRVQRDDRGVRERQRERYHAPERAGEASSTAAGRVRRSQEEEEKGAAPGGV